MGIKYVRDICGNELAADALAFSPEADVISVNAPLGWAVQVIRPPRLLPAQSAGLVRGPMVNPQGGPMVSMTCSEACAQQAQQAMSDELASIYRKMAMR